MAKRKNGAYPLYDRMPPVSSISHMLELKASTIPDKTAFRYRKGRDQTESKTYADVYREVRKAAAWIEHNIGTKQHIAVIGENSYEWLIAFFAILASGNVAAAIDKELPANEVAWMIGKADVTAAFVSKTYSDLVEGIDGLKVTTLKGLQTAAEAESEEYTLYKPERDEPASIFFTSGTSGRSKAVMLSHGNLASEITDVSKLFDPEDAESVLAVLPFHHTFGLNVAILMAYYYGVTIFLNKSLKNVQDDLKLAKPDVIMLVPMFIEVLYKKIQDGIKKSGKEKKVEKGIKFSNFLLKLGIDKRRKLFKDILDVFGGNLKYIISGGAFLDQSYIKTYHDFGIEILNGYGTTECSPCVAVNRNYHQKAGSVGMKVPGTEFRISADGEVQVKGPVTMLGYYNEPEATAEVLQDGWYSTGDLGRVDDEGFVFLTGRKKNLIILSNGENISPEELEQDFRLDPGVNEVLVYDRKNMIIAEIFPEEEFMGNTEYFNALMAKVNTGRPAYKQVAKVVLRTEDFIRNTSKKVVRYKNIPKEEE